MGAKDDVRCCLALPGSHDFQISAYLRGMAMGADFIRRNGIRAFWEMERFLRVSTAAGNSGGRIYNNGSPYKALCQSREDPYGSSRGVAAGISDNKRARCRKSLY